MEDEYIHDVSKSELLIKRSLPEWVHMNIVVTNGECQINPLSSWDIELWSDTQVCEDIWHMVYLTILSSLGLNINDISTVSLELCNLSKQKTCF
jgi:hypothetical protein